MTLAINHLTRMERGFICVAGVDLQMNRHVRPVLAGTRLGKGLLKKNGGPFDIGCVAELHHPQPTPTKPETEDHEFNAAAVRRHPDMDAAAFWKLLQGLESNRLSIPSRRQQGSPRLRRPTGGSIPGEPKAGAAAVSLQG